jgi:hypothetical protein
MRGATLPSPKHVFIAWYLDKHKGNFTFYRIRGPFDKFVNRWQCGAIMQREAVTVMPSYSVGGNVVVA